MAMRTALVAIIILLTVSWVESGTIDDMRIHGSGQAYYLRFIKVYDAALYTEQLATEEEILRGAVSKCLLLQYQVSLSQEDFIKAANTVLERQFSDEDLELVRKEIDQLHTGYLDVKDGDRYTLCYDKKLQSTALSHNGKELVRIYSKPFAGVYFSIWLGRENPLDEGLRDDLLSRN